MKRSACTSESDRRSPRRFFHLDLSQIVRTYNLPHGFLRRGSFETVESRERSDGRAAKKNLADTRQILRESLRYVVYMSRRLSRFAPTSTAKSGSIKNHAQNLKRETPKFAACTGDCADCNLRRSRVARETNDRMDALRDRSAWTYCPSWQERVTDTRRFRAILPRVEDTRVCARVHVYARMHAFVYISTHSRMHA